MGKHIDSLQGLLLRRVGLPLLGLLVCSGIGSFALARHYAGEVYDRWLLDSAMSLAELVEVDDGRPHMRVSARVSRMFTWDTVDEVHGEVLAGDGRRIYGDLAQPLPGPPAAEGERPQYYDAQLRGQPVRMVEVMRSVEGGGWVRLRVAETLRKRARLEQKLLLSSLPLQGVILALAAWLAWRSTRAAARYSNAVAHRLSAPRPDALAPLVPQREAPRELWPAVEAFNALLRRLAAMQQAQQRFVSNAAHQLRTPLATMQLELESALRLDDSDARQAALSGVVASLTRLRHLVHQLLLLSRSEPGDAAVVTLRPTDVALLARDLLERFMDRAVAAGVDLGYEGPDEGAIVDAEPELLREALANLLDNALRYGRPRGVITLRVALRATVCEVHVDDDGGGIPPDQRALVTERFYRAHPETDGCGLGLAIVSEIARLHGSRVGIATSPLGGVRISLQLPAGST